MFAAKAQLCPPELGCRQGPAHLPVPGSVTLAVPVESNPLRWGQVGQEHLWDPAESELQGAGVGLRLRQRLVQKGGGGKNKERGKEVAFNQLN